MLANYLKVFEKFKYFLVQYDYFFLNSIRRKKDNFDDLADLYRKVKKHGDLTNRLTEEGRALSINATINDNAKIKKFYEFLVNGTLISESSNVKSVLDFANATELVEIANSEFIARHHRKAKVISETSNISTNNSVNRPSVEAVSKKSSKSDAFKTGTRQPDRNLVVNEENNICKGYFYDIFWEFFDDEITFKSFCNTENFLFTLSKVLIFSSLNLIRGNIHMFTLCHSRGRISGKDTGKEGFNGFLDCEDCYNIDTNDILLELHSDNLAFYKFDDKTPTTTTTTGYDIVESDTEINIKQRITANLIMIVKNTIILNLISIICKNYSKALRLLTHTNNSKTFLNTNYVEAIEKSSKLFIGHVITANNNTNTVYETPTKGDEGELTEKKTENSSEHQYSMLLKTCHEYINSYCYNHKQEETADLGTGPLLKNADSESNECKQEFCVLRDLFAWYLGLPLRGTLCEELFQMGFANTITMGCQILANYVKGNNNPLPIKCPSCLFLNHWRNYLESSGLFNDEEANESVFSLKRSITRSIGYDFGHSIIFDENNKAIIGPKYIKDIEYMNIEQVKNPEKFFESLSPTMGGSNILSFSNSTTSTLDEIRVTLPLSPYNTMAASSASSYYYYTQQSDSYSQYKTNEYSSYDTGYSSTQSSNMCTSTSSQESDHYSQPRADILPAINNDLESPEENEHNESRNINDSFSTNDLLVLGEAYSTSYYHSNNDESYVSYDESTDGSHGNTNVNKKKRTKEHFKVYF